MGSDDELMTARQVADYLGVTTRMVAFYVQTGRLPRAGKQVRHYLYNLSDVNLLLEYREGKKTGRLEEAWTRAARAESLAADNARMIDHIYMAMGIKYDPPDLEEEGIRYAYRHAKDLVDPDGPGIMPAEAIELSRTVHRINEVYLRLVEDMTKDPTPWGVFAGAIAKALVEMEQQSGPEAHYARFYLTSAQRHLRHVAFEYVRTCHGHVEAEEMIEYAPGPFDEEIVAIVLASTKTS